MGIPGGMAFISYEPPPYIHWRVLPQSTDEKIVSYVY